VSFLKRYILIRNLGLPGLGIAAGLVFLALTVIAMLLGSITQ
jgi:hypothetical protein